MILESPRCGLPMDAENGISNFSDVWLLAIEGSGTGIWDRNLVTDEIRYSPS